VTHDKARELAAWIRWHRRPLADISDADRAELLAVLDGVAEQIRRDLKLTGRGGTPILPFTRPPAEEEEP
jgi:hypothetical protein